MESPPLRKDAARNWQRIVAVARQLVDEGSALQLNDVARLADVGVATVYRHFPTPEALLETVATPCLESLILHGEQALADDDPWQALSTFLGHIIDTQITDASLSAVSAAAVNVMPRTIELKNTLGVIAGQLLERARSAGVVRAEVAVGDLTPLMCGITFAASAHDNDPVARIATARRYLSLMLTGLHA